MKLDLNVFEKVSNSFKLGARVKANLMYLIENSFNYWEVDNKGKELLNKSHKTKDKKLAYAFSDYCNSTNQRGNNVLSEKQIQADENFIKTEFKKVEKLISKCTLETIQNEILKY